MKKNGRPKDPKKARNRRHTLLLSEQAYKIYLDKFWGRGKEFNQMCSEFVVDNFSTKEATLKFRIFKLEKQRNEIELEMEFLVGQLRKIKVKGE